MRIQIAIMAPVLISLAVAAPVEKLRNEKVVSLAYALKPGESAPLSGRPSVTVYFDNGMVEITAPGQAASRSVKRGDSIFRSAGAGEIRNAGSADLTFVRTEFLTGGSPETWGSTGLSPNYKLLFENRYTRVYDIRIEAGRREPQHTHHARVVVCLSGAVLKHLMPDGREEPSTLKTGEVVFRPGATHIGVNLDKTDLWVIAIEPK
jgi:quercetin dioxygenase-like cupin family protein